MRRACRLVAAILLVVSVGASVRALPAHAGGGSGLGTLSVVVQLPVPIPTPQP